MTEATSENENPGALGRATADELLRVSRGFVDAKYLRAVRRLPEPEFRRLLRAVEMQDAEDAWVVDAWDEGFQGGGL